jgi:UDP-N-acetyl-D-galactosamine dehydrogenase
MQALDHVNLAVIGLGYVMGLTFKENCPDIRNSRVVDILEELADYNVVADVFDPWVDAAEARREYGVTPVSEPRRGGYDAIVLAVAHDQFRRMGADAIRAFGKHEHVLYDLKYVLPRHAADLRL